MSKRPLYLQHDNAADLTGAVRRCRHCGKAIQGRRPQAVFCSTRCQIAAEQRRYQRRHKTRLAAYQREYRKRRKAAAEGDRPHGVKTLQG